MPDLANHPADDTLASFSLGKTDDATTDLVARHLVICAACRRRVAGQPADSFVGKVTSDTKNASDASGTAAFPLDPAVFDWSHFDNAYRAWGLDGSAFPDQFQRGRWTAGTGRIWDWSVSSGDSGNSGSPALRGVLVLPTGNDTLTHIWSGIPGTSDSTHEEIAHDFVCLGCQKISC